MPEPVTSPAKPRNKGGRPSNAQREALLADEGQAFESIKRKWTYISHKLADEASKAARDHKKLDGKSLVALCTAAGIAYDKRWSKQVSDTQEISIPPSLAASVTAKLITDKQGNQQVKPEVAHLSQVCDSADQAEQVPAAEPGPETEPEQTGG